MEWRSSSSSSRFEFEFEFTPFLISLSLKYEQLLRPSLLSLIGIPRLRLSDRRKQWESIPRRKVVSSIVTEQPSTTDSNPCFPLKSISPSFLNEQKLPPPVISSWEAELQHPSAERDQVKVRVAAGQQVRRFEPSTTGD